MKAEQWTAFTDSVIKRTSSHGKPPRITATRLAKLCDYIAQWYRAHGNKHCRAYLLCRFSKYRKCFFAEMANRLGSTSVANIVFGYPLTVSELYAARGLPLLIVVPTDDCGLKELDIIGKMRENGATVVHEPDLPNADYDELLNTLRQTIPQLTLMELQQLRLLSDELVEHAMEAI